MVFTTVLVLRYIADEGGVPAVVLDLKRCEPNRAFSNVSLYRVRLGPKWPTFRPFVR